MRTSDVIAGACVAIGLLAGIQPASAQPVGAHSAGAQSAAVQSVGVQSVGAQSAVYLAGNCTTCHGPGGRSVAEMPELAGLSPAYFVEQVALFRDGKRQGTIMNQIAKGYTEAEIAALAEWFSKQEPSRGEVPK